MCSFRAKWTAILLLAFTKELASVQSQTVTQERMTPAKMASDLLRVPWMNLNNSWTAAGESRCEKTVRTVIDSADAGEMWALKMLDASSKLPSGIIMGNILDLGSYDECVGVKNHHNLANVEGQHCMISFSIPTKFVADATSTLRVQSISAYNPSAKVNLSLTLSVCLPSVCDVDDVGSLVNSCIQNTPTFDQFDVSVARIICSDIRATSDSYMGFFLTTSVFAFVGGVLLVCTACDFIVRSRPGNAYDEYSVIKILAKFSLYTNILKLTDTRMASGTMPAIQGMRFLSTCGVICLHTSLVTYFIPTVNLSDLHSFRGTVIGLFIVMTTYMVDTFFIISGFLATYSFLKKMQKQAKFNILMFYFHRYVRITPCIAVLILFNIFITPHLGSGPLWPIIMGKTINYCRKNWWTNLLYVQNLVNRDEMCMLHTWYLAAEMQLYFISPVVFYPLSKRPKFGLLILGALSIASFIIPVVIVVVYHYAFALNPENTAEEMYYELLHSYTVTYNRALPYFVGISLAYYVADRKKELGKMQVAFNWFLASVCVSYCFCNVDYIMPNALLYNTVAEALYVSVGRLAWSLAMAWILYACTHGHGGPVTRFLSLPIFIPLSRLCYGMYLVGFLLQTGVISTVRTAEYFSYIRLELLFWGHLALTIGGAVVLYLLIETPVLILEKIITAKRPPLITKPCSMETKETFSTSNGAECSKPTDDSKDCDFSTKIETIQMDFWRSMADVLNNLSNNPPKTPREWKETWQKWESNVMKNDSQQPNHESCDQHKSAGCQTVTVPSGPEFSRFLVHVNRGLDNGVEV